MRSGISFGQRTIADRREIHSRLRPSTIAALFFILLSSQFARADLPLASLSSDDSVSGQFSVTVTPGYSDLDTMPLTGTDAYVHLQPALLAVSADRVRAAFLHKLGLHIGAPWNGKIYLVLHPAQSLNENVEIFSSRFGDGWNYHVLLPDMLPRDRLERALTGVLLLEYANRNATDRSAEVPPWLVDGLSQELLGGSMQALILSTPDRTENNIPVERMSVNDQGLDSLAGARQVLQNYSVLTFSQLSWPTDVQLYDADGGAYRASAQLFVDELLALHNGPAKLRAMVEALPRYYNWQTAFWQAFPENFSSPLQVEKWWALQTVIFTSKSPGPQWTAKASREKLDEILTVPIEYHVKTNSLPMHATVSLQRVIENFGDMHQTEILQNTLRDLELAQLRMAPTFAILTAEYRNALAGYLGEPLPVHGKVLVNNRAPTRVSARDTLAKLNALDAQRRAVAVVTLPREIE